MACAACCLIHKDIYYFLFETPSGAILQPDPTQHTYDAKWVPLKKVLQTSSYADLEPIIKKAVGYLYATTHILRTR